MVADAQRDLIERLDNDPDPEAVCDRLEGHLRELRSGAVNPDELVIARLEAPGELQQRTQTVTALQRARQHDVAKHRASRSSMSWLTMMRDRGNGFD